MNTEPLCSIEAEQAVLGAIIINNLAYHQVSGLLRPEHFYEPIHARTFEACARLIGNGRMADHITLQAEMRAWAEANHMSELRSYMGGLAGAAQPVITAREYAEVIVELAGRRALAQEAGDAAAAANDLTYVTSLPEQIANLRHRLDAIDHAYQHRDNWHSVADVLARAMHRSDNAAPAYSTGLSCIDASLAGGIAPGRVYGIEARPKGFKTGLLGTVALSLIRQDVPFLFLALEMGAERILERMVAAETGCNAIRFRSRKDPVDCKSRFEVFLDAYGNRRGYWADEPGLSFARLRAIASDAVNKLGIRAMFLDYWQLVTGVARGQSSAEHLTEVAQWLAAFAARHDVAVVIASQTNRDGFGYGSDGLAKACDWLGRLHKVDQVDRSMGEFEALWIEVVHNRDGSDGNLGSAEAPALRIDKLGPVLREYGDWERRPLLSL